MSDPTVSDTLTLFRQAIANLTWMSESDYPFEVCLRPDAPVEAPAAALLPAVASATLQTQDDPVRELSLEEFFGNAVQEREWHGEAERAIAHRFQNLVDLIRTHLHDVHVFSVGQVAIDFYVVGKTADDQWLILSTRAIET